MKSSNLKPGDLIGFSSFDWSGFVINLGTYGIPFYDISHIGIISEHQGQLMLFESTTFCNIPCSIQGIRVNGTQCHPLEDRMKGYFGSVWHYPLLWELSESQRAELSAFLHSQIARPYDLAGAFRSSGKIFSYIESLFSKSNDESSLYCSEWCALAHRKIGLFRTRSASKWSPNALVRAEFEQEIIGKRVRLDAASLHLA
jgi:hypothetical protein